MVVLLSEVTTVPNRYILAKVNANGDVVWGSRIQQQLTLNSISVTDNGYLICGQTTTDDAILIKVSETGSIAVQLSMMPKTLTCSMLLLTPVV